MSEIADAPASGQNSATKSSIGSSLISKTVSENTKYVSPTDSDVASTDLKSNCLKDSNSDSKTAKDEDKITDTIIKQSTPTSQTSKSVPLPLPLPKVKMQSTPIQIPKVINTPEGTIPLNSNIKTSMKKSNNNSSKSNNPQPVKSSTTNNKSSVGNIKSASASKSILSNMSSGTTHPAPKIGDIGLVPIQPNPNTAPSIQFHPIAIKPKLKSAQPSLTKTRLKSVSLSRTNSAVSPSKKEQEISIPGNTITLSTSKNWVLPPRPKTKKICKKKEKKVIKSNVGDANIPKTGPVNLKRLPSSTATSASPSPSPLLTTAVLSSGHVTHTSSSKATSGSVKVKNENNAAKEKSISEMSAHNSNKCTSTNCTGCSKVCIANGIRSVYQDKVTGKVLINAQIHSNINLYTNNEKELEVQLQHVSRENDNLKKILLKLNKEIQNLRIAKKKDDDELQCTKKIKSGKPEKSSTTMNINLPPLENETVKSTDLGFSSATNSNTINPLNLSFTTDNKRQKVLSVSPDFLESNFSSPNLEPVEPKKSTAKTKTKTKAKSKKASTPNSSKKYHSCGVCEINKACFCFENTSKSIASGIVQAFSGGNSKILGIGNQSGVTAMKTPGSVGTLVTMLQRENIMKKLKEDRAGVKPYSESKMETNDTNVNDGVFLKANEFPSLNMIDGNKNTQDEGMMGSAKFEEDDNLLQMIDAELLLDPTPMVPSKLMKKSNSLQATNEQMPASTGMRKSESKNSDQNSMDYFSRGTLLDFNPFNSNDMMMHNDFNELNNETKFNDTLKNNNDISMTPSDYDNNDTSLHSTLLFENTVCSGDEFMMY